MNRIMQLFLSVSFLALLFILVRGKTQPSAQPGQTPASAPTPATTSVPTPTQLAAEQTQTTATISLILKRLITSHPDPSISRDLHALIEKGGVYLNFQPEIFNGSGSLATVMLVNTPTTGEVLTLSIDPVHLANPQQSDAYKQLVIYHEYQHIRQHREQRYPREMLMQVLRPDLLTERDIRLQLDAEVEAYEAEVLLAVKLGWQQHLPEFCQAYANGGRNGLYRLLAARYERENGIYALHPAVLRRIASEH